MSAYCENQPAFYTEKLVKIRKPHKCCETRQIMPVGTMAWRITGKWDGGVDRYYQCDEAYRFARKINGVEPYRPDYDEECIPFGGIAEYVNELRHFQPDCDEVKEWDAIIASSTSRERPE